MPTSPKLQKAMVLYGAIMEEAKVRFQSIEDAVNNRLPVTPPIAQEFCYLQLRMLCDLIAFGCLLAHGDITAADRLHREWAADKIINDLERLNLFFFPAPVEQIAKGPGQFELKAVESGFLTKKQYIELYRQCGNNLHRGNLKKLIKPDAKVIVDFKKIADITMKMSILLNHHLIGLADEKGVLICMLRNRNDGNRVQVAHAEKPSAQPKQTSR